VIIAQLGSDPVPDAERVLTQNVKRPATFFAGQSTTYRCCERIVRLGVVVW
jgi:hypothetical protein